ncbi:DUF2249 domain-containing protein [Tepidibacillus marianensis]|uniref:DUF2249 domain-containing protein n=1 Tax=Tepidibacillus marianensis TaxID=3131995 RepID=UPI0030D58E72
MANAVRNGNIVELDVREMQKAKDEPFHIIMDTVETLQEGEQLVLHAIIHPVPLINVMNGRGLASDVKQIAEDHWQITFLRSEQDASTRQSWIRTTTTHATNLTSARRTLHGRNIKDYQ